MELSGRLNITTLSMSGALDVNKELSGRLDELRYLHEDSILALIGAGTLEEPVLLFSMFGPFTEDEEYTDVEEEEL